MFAQLSSKGQLVIPKAIRLALGLQAGARFHVWPAEGKIILELVVSSPIAALRGKYPDADFLSDLEEEHRREVSREAAIRA